MPLNWYLSILSCYQGKVERRGSGIMAGKFLLDWALILEEMMSATLGLPVTIIR